jgi:general secretion pathway protein L
MKFAVLDKPLRRVEEAYARSSIRRFLQWWKAELLGCLPTAWRERLIAPPLLVVAERQDSGLMLRRVRGDTVLAELPLSDPETQIHLVKRFVADEKEPAEQVWLKLPMGRVLRRRITLPAAAEENLLQILSFEMDRQTPFKADQVYFDQRIVKRDLRQSQIVVELAAVPRPTLDAELEVIQGFKLTLDGVDGPHERKPGVLAGFNLLPSAQRVTRVDRQKRINWILAAAAVALLFTAMSQHLDARRAAVDALRDEVDADEKAAAQVRALESKVRDAIVGAGFLTDKKCSTPQVINVMLELTERLPDDTWLERLSFVSRQVQIQGQSAEANRLIGLLQDAKTVANPQVQGVIQPDPGTGKDRFTIQLDQRAGSVCAAPELAPPVVPGAASNEAPSAPATTDEQRSAEVKS